MFLKRTKGDESYFLLLISRENAEALSLTLNPDRHVAITHYTEALSLAESNPFGRGSMRNIVGLHPTVAYSLSIPLEVKRDQGATSLLTATEVENLLTKEVSQRFIQLRDEASVALEIDRIDTILADSRVGNFRVNGRRVINPVGCAAETFEAVIDLTFTSRNLYERVKDYLRRRTFFFTDAGRATLQLLKKSESLPLGILALSHPHSVFLKMDKVGKKDPTFRRDTVKWSTSALRDLFVSHWHVDPDVAHDISKRYAEKKMPQEVDRFVAERYKKVLAPLEKIVHKLPTRSKNYLISDRPLPPDSPLLKDIPPFPSLIGALQKMGFTLNEEDVLRLENHPLLLGIFADYFSDRGHADINRWLRRRLHWLGSVEYN